MRIMVMFSIAVLWNVTVAAQGSVTVSQKEYGDKWPLTVSAGTLRCIGPAQSIVIDVPGKGTYAINGTAKTIRKRNPSTGWKLIDDIWRPDPSNKGLKVNIGPLIDRGLALCRR